MGGGSTCKTPAECWPSSLSRTDRQHSCGSADTASCWRAVCADPFPSFASLLRSGCSPGTTPALAPPSPVLSPPCRRFQGTRPRAGPLLKVKAPRRVAVLKTGSAWERGAAPCSLTVPLSRGAAPLAVETLVLFCVLCSLSLSLHLRWGVCKSLVTDKNSRAPGIQLSICSRTICPSLLTDSPRNSGYVLVRGRLKMSAGQNWARAAGSHSLSFHGPGWLNLLRLECGT